MTTHEKMHNGSLYSCDDAALVQEQLHCLDRLYEFNHTRPLEQDKRQALLQEMFAEVGEGCYIEPPLHANWAGKFVHLGGHGYANYNLRVVDDTRIDIGEFTMIGPNVTMATGGHPMLPALREKVYQFNLPIRVGKNCWIGAGAILLPGVTIGDNSVIGAGSVVTRDIPANVVAVGNPCRVLRPIGPQDVEYYRKGRPIPAEVFRKAGISLEEEG